MNTQVKLLDAAVDRKDGHLVIYYVGMKVNLDKFEPVKAIEKARKKIYDITETIKYLNGDPEAEPADEILCENGINAYLYNDNSFGVEYYEMMKEEYIQKLHQRCKTLEKLIAKLEQLETTFEAGVLPDAVQEFNALVDEYGVELELL